MPTPASHSEAVVYQYGLLSPPFSFEVWSLDLLWMLDVGCWMLLFPLLSPHSQCRPSERCFVSAHTRTANKAPCSHSTPAAFPRKKHNRSADSAANPHTSPPRSPPPVQFRAAEPPAGPDFLPSLA